MIDYELGKPLFWIGALALWLPLWAFCAQAADPVKMPGEPLQAVVVVAEDWQSSTATLRRHEREHPDKPWKAVGKKIPVMVGRKGLAWGTGIHPSFPEADPVKKEGDGKAPAGIFRLSSAFGTAKPDAMNRVRLPYRQATPDLLCVDDTSSAAYNQLVDSAQVKSDWKSYEQMYRKDDQYRLGIVVDYNRDPVVPGRGSCIFLHIWAGPGIGTAGCTAMAAKDLAVMLHWLDPQARPVLVQLTEAAYGRYRQAWELP